jgi:hypothetical protein
LSYQFINKNKDYLNRLNETSLDIFGKNLDIIHSALRKYEVKEKEERNSILEKRYNHNKIFYEPVINKRTELENIRREIDLVESKIDDEKIAHAFAYALNQEILDSELSSTLKKLQTKINIENKNLKNLEKIYSSERENTNIPFGENTICMDSLECTLKLIDTCKKNIIENEYNNSFDNKTMIPYYIENNISNIKKEYLLEYIRFRKVETEQMFYDIPKPIINSDDELTLTVIYDIKERQKLIESLLKINKNVIDATKLENEIKSLWKSCSSESDNTKKGEYLVNRFNSILFEVVIVKKINKSVSCDISTYIIDFDKTILDL